MNKNQCTCDEAEDSHDHCLECDCILTWMEGDICFSCEESIECNGFTRVLDDGNSIMIEETK